MDTDLAGPRNMVRNQINQINIDEATSALPSGTLSRRLPGSTLTSLVATLDRSSARNDLQKCFEDIVLLENYLAEDRVFEHDDASEDAALFLREWVAGAILPTETFAEPTAYSTEEKLLLTPDEIARFHAMSSVGILLLSHVQKIYPLSPDQSIVGLLTSLVSFSDLNDPWTCTRAREQARSLVEYYVGHRELSTLLTQLLQERVKPLFARSKNPAITQQGRKAIDPLPSNATAHSGLDAETKPWKYRDVYIVTVFQWILTRLTRSSLEANWPLVIPPLLALIDDTSTVYKIKGCKALSVFLRTCPSLLLQRTGLAEVFESAVMPCLLYLPSLTEEAESLRVLEAAYRALISLAMVRFANEEQRRFRTKSLDRIFHHGIMKGYAHAGEHVKIAELLVNQIADLTNKMGIGCAKQLKYTIPLLTANLSAPLATAYPPLLKASLNAAQMIILNAWPRIAHHRGEILKGLTLCWCRLRVEETKSKELKDIQRDIERTTKLLTSVVRRIVDVVEEYQVLINSDSRLWELLTV